LAIKILLSQLLNLQTLYILPKDCAMMNTDMNKHELREPGALQEQEGGDSDPSSTGVSEALEEHRLTPEETEQLKEQAAKATENREQMLRVAADFENFKKRAARERQETTKYANESMLQKLIPVLDNFDMALAATSSAQKDTLQQLQAGVAMIHQQLRNVLTEAGLEELDATNKTFDPNWHEAVAQQESAEVPEGQVLQQLRKGYKLRDRLLRPATVVVAKKPSETNS
jgi:molecular chaperone GrpE